MENGSKRPKYFGDKFLKLALEDGFARSDVKIRNSEISFASLGGDNYSSDIYRVKVEYVFEEDEDTSVKEIHLILKDMRSEIEEILIVKSKEAAMYRTVVPELERILDGEELFAPKLFTAVKYDSEVYVFQDLNALGYELKNRVTGLNEKDCITLLKKIGKFHATSMVFAEKFPEVIDKIKDNVLQYGTKDSKAMHDFMINMIRSASEVIRTWPGYESISDKIYAFSEAFHEKAIEAYDRKNCRYMVINHGDLWVNNFLMKDDDVAFIDLQLANYGSPAYDINYFLYSSVPLDLLKQKRYEFLRIYFNQFQKTLQRIQYEKIPSWEDFTYEMRRMEFSGVYSAISVLPIVSLCKDDSKGTNIETLLDEDAFVEKKRAMFGSKRVVETLKYALDRFNDIGALD